MAEHREMNLGKQFPRCPCVNRVPWSSLLKGKSLKRACTFAPLGLFIPEVPSRHLSYSTVAKYFASFIGITFFSNHTLYGNTFKHIPFMARLQVSQIFPFCSLFPVSPQIQLKEWAIPVCYVNTVLPWNFPCQIKQFITFKLSIPPCFRKFSAVGSLQSNSQ